ncbi:hypothetical protein Acr_06g0007400 [Actinidia rufa]|uniref:Uncharacterized protein n=1 Tax=Actinidia rufa TaxID=165716 RepID=A0A7J0ER80_9ERIC|nr:hypothetical protein Acr_06g0007400 [Actinidia rufa]
MFEPILGRTMDAFIDDMVGELRKKFGTYGNETRDQSQPRTNHSDQQPRHSKNCEGCSETNWDDEGELLYVYLSISKYAISSVLLREKLMHYFQAHPIAVYPEFRLKNILSKADLSSKLSKWAIELGQSYIKFLPRAAIKGQVLDDFVAEFSPQAMSLERGCLVSAHERRENSEVGPPKNQSTLGDPEVIQEPPQNAKPTTDGEMTGVLKEELAELRKSSELCPNDLPKYTWKDVGEELAELQEGAELCPLKILPKVYLVIFAIRLANTDDLDYKIYSIEAAKFQGDSQSRLEDLQEAPGQTGGFSWSIAWKKDMIRKFAFQDHTQSITKLPKIGHLEAVVKFILPQARRTQD